MIQEIIKLYQERWPFFGTLILQHIQISMTAILIAGAAGLVIGTFISFHRKLAAAVIGVINVIYTVPSISMLGFLIPFTGIGNKTAIIALTVYGLLPMVRNTCTGIATIDPALVEAARGMGSTEFQILYKVKFPVALPVIVSGVRSMVVMTVSLSGIASYIGAGGLGVAVYRGITTNNMYMTYAGSILIAAVALLSDQLVAAAERAIRRKRRMAHERN